MSDARTLGRLTGLNLLNALLGLAQTVVMASLFGTDRVVEVYFAAVGLHASLVSLAQTGQISEVLLPSYHAMRESRGRQDAFHVYTALVNRFLLVLGVIGIGGWILAPLLTRLRVPGFEANDIAIATQMFRWILPVVVLQVGAELFKTLANAERMFGAPEAIAAVARVASLTTLVLLAGRLDIWALVVAMWCAALIEAVAIVWRLQRSGLRYRLILNLPGGGGDVRLFRKLVSTLPYVGFTQIFLFVLDAALSNLRQGSFALFRYAVLISARTNAIFLRPVLITFFTDFSEDNARRSGAGVTLARRALARSLAISAIVTTSVLTGAHGVLTGLWGGERFPEEQISTLVWLLAGLYAVFPVSSAAALLRKVTVSVGRVRETYLALAAVQVFSAIVAWPLVTNLGLIGALTMNAINLIGFCAAPLAVLRMTGRPVQIQYPYARLWRWIVAVTTGFVAAYVVERFAIVPSLTGGWQRVAEIISGGFLAVVGTLVVLAVSYWLGVPEARQLVDFVERVLLRRSS